MRERFDAGTGLVALGAALLLVSLFVDWFDPSGDAWAVFEIADVVLALAAIACLVAVVPRYAALARAVPAIAFVALLIVAVQLISPPPAARGDDLAAGAWLALGATALMALGATLSAASISVTVDVRGRERRRRISAIDARERAAAAAEAERAEEEAEPAREPETTPVREAPRARRRPPEPAEQEPGLWRRGDAREDDEAAPAPHASDPPVAAEPPADPDRTQAFDPVLDRPKDGP